MSSKRGHGASDGDDATKHNQFHSIIDRLKTAAASDRAAYDALTLEDARSRLDASRRIGFNVTASLEIEQARKRQLVETFLKHEMQLPTIEKSDDDEDGANATRGAEDALEASLRDEKKEGKKNDDDDDDDDIAQLKRRLATSQLEARKNLRLAKRTRRLCDAMVQMLKDKGVEQLEPPRAL
jgi:DNA-directed RNA polymerase specialized sigma54-like protein